MQTGMTISQLIRSTSGLETTESLSRGDGPDALVDDVVEVRGDEDVPSSAPTSVTVVPEALWPTLAPILTDGSHGAATIVVADRSDVRQRTSPTDTAIPVFVTDGSLSASAVSAAVLRTLLRAVVDQVRFDDVADLGTVTLETLITGEPARRVAATERAAALGWDLHRSRAVLLASIDPPVDHASAESVLATIAAAARATLGPDAIVWTRASMIAALLAPTDPSASTRRLLADALRAELDTRVRSVTLSIGVGRCVTDPCDLAGSFVDASRAVDVGRWAKGRHVTELYDELGLERLLASAAQDDLHEFVMHAIGPLIEHDRQHHSSLLDTLSMWLTHRNVAAASREMFVHYNTFKNRLDRIEQILGPLLNDAARLLECEVAIHVARHYDGSWT
ncbi:PucR family transcriptional regulator [Actinospongicola halichondriae]|uniref:PucR family transcriptional regulator n=1 Tax=Actinospongicola halichondriae TaxID=3236844 RepID=UPI003D4114A3